MLLHLPPIETAGAVQRLERTAALLERRGYALPAPSLGRLCLGGALDESEVRRAVAASGHLRERAGLILTGASGLSLASIAARRRTHSVEAARFVQSAQRFSRWLAAACPHVLSVALAGSLASGGFRASDDVDLNLVVEDGTRHLTYVVLNVLGAVHALGHLDKPVDTHSRRPLAPRLMTANLILERSECFPLARLDEDMAYELLVAEPLFGAGFYRSVLDHNPDLAEHFPQLAGKSAPLAVTVERRLPPALLPVWLERPSRTLARAGWRGMQWTRRHRPEALARVEYVRRTMRPYVLFPDL